jgi:hypothetical protein
MIHCAKDCLKATPPCAHPSTRTQWTSVATRENERNEINVDIELYPSSQWSLFLSASPHDETWEHQLGYSGQRNLGLTPRLPLYNILVPCCPQGKLDF